MRAREKHDGARIAPATIAIGSRRTSIRLEPIMWDALEDIAAARGKTVHDIVVEINRMRGQAGLSSAIRVYIVEFYRARFKVKA